MICFFWNLSFCVFRNTLVPESQWLKSFNGNLWVKHPIMHRWWINGPLVKNDGLPNRWAVWKIFSTLFLRSWNLWICKLFMVDSTPILSPLSLSSSANNKWVKIFLKSFVELPCGDTKFSETVLWTKWVSDFCQSEILLPSQWKKNSLMKIYSNVQSYVLSVKLTITATKYGNW